MHGGFASADTLLAAEAGLEWDWEWDFARRFDFTWYDRRGCYRSACPPDGYELENQARDLVGLLDHLGVASAHVVGSSAGGPIALVAAATWPARVRSLVLVGTATHLFPPDDPTTEVVRAQVARLERDGPEAAFASRPAGVEATYATLWGRDEAEARGTVDEWLRRQSELAAWAAQLPREVRVLRHAAELRSMAAYLERDVRPEAERVRAPTLVLHGSADATVPLAGAEALADAVPGAQLHVVSGGPHSLLWRGDEGRRVAIGWLEGVERG